MRISTAQYFETSAAKYQKNYSDTVKTQAQISSGDRIQSASDDPIGASRLLQLQQQKALLTQYGENMTSLKSSLTTEESVLSGINDSLQKARELAIQGGGSISDEDRRSIANQIGEIEKQVLGMLNTKDSAGEYLLSGSKSSTPPYIQNSDGTYSYQGDETQLSLQVSDTLSLASNDTGYSLTEQTPNASRTQASQLVPTLPAVINDRVSVSSGLIASDVAYTNDFKKGEPYTVTFSSSTQFKVFSGTTDVTAEIAGNGSFDPGAVGGSTFKLRGVDFEINAQAKAEELPADFDQAISGQSFSLTSKPDDIKVTRLAANTSSAQITSASVDNAANYSAAFPNGGAVLRFGAVSGTDIAYSVFAQPYKEGDTAIASGVKTAADTSITAAGVKFDFAAGFSAPASGDQFAAKVTAHETKSVLNTLADLRQALLAPTGNSTAAQNKLDEAIGSALSNLSLSMDRNDLVRGSIGARMNSIDIQTTENGTISLNNKATQTDIGSTDVADASIQLTLQQTMLQASQLAFVKISQLSLFNKL